MILGLGPTLGKTSHPNRAKPMSALGTLQTPYLGNVMTVFDRPTADVRYFEDTATGEANFA
jgi:hypothetical protein